MSCVTRRASRIVGLAAIAATAMSFGVVGTASGGTDYWTNNTSTNLSNSSSLWTIATNSATPTNPVSGDAWYFANATGITLTNNFATPWTVNGITFGSAAGADTFVGNAITLTAGITNASANSQTFSNNLIVNTNITINGSTAAGFNFAGNFQGSGTIAFTGTGSSKSYNLTGDNSQFAGYIDVQSAGNPIRFRLNSASAGSGSATWNLNNQYGSGMSLNFGNGTISFGALTGSGNLRNESTANTTAVFRVGDLNTNSTFGGTLGYYANTFISLLKVGTGTLTLTSATGFNGTTTVTNGTLLVQSSGALGSGALAISNGASLNMNFNSTTAQTFSGGLSGAGTYTVSGTNLTIFSGASTYTGTYQVQAGAIEFQNTNAWGSAAYTSSNGVVLSNGGAVIFGVTSFGTNNLSTLYSTFAAGTGTAVFGYDTTGTNYTNASNIIDGTAKMGIASAGSGTLQLTGANTFSGGVRLYGGTLGVNTGTSYGTGAISVINSSTIGALNNGSLTNAINTLNASTLTFANGTYTLTNSGNITGNGSLTFVGSGTTFLTGSNSSTGAYSLNGGKLTLTGSNAVGVTLANGTTLELQANAGNTSAGVSKAMGGTWGQSGSSGTATLRLLSDTGVTFYGGDNGGVPGGWGTINFYVGNINSGNSNNVISFATNGFNLLGMTFNFDGTNGYSMSMGTLTNVGGAGVTVALNANTASATIKSVVTDNSASSQYTLALGGSNTGVIQNGVAGGLNAGNTKAATLSKKDAGTWNINGVSYYLGSITISGGTLVIGGVLNNGASNTVGAYNGTISDSGSFVMSNSTAQTLSGAISGTGTLVQSGSGTTTLSVSNSYSGGTIINAGQVVMGNTNALGTGNVTLNVNGGLNFGSLTSVNFGLLSGKGSLALTNSSGAAVALNLAGTGTSTYGGNLSGTGGLVLTNGTQILSGSNSYGGTTVVGGGALEFLNTNSFYGGNTASWTASKLTVSNGATAAFGVTNFGDTAIQSLLSTLTSSNGAGLLSGALFGLDSTGTNYTFTNNLANGTNGALGLAVLGSGTTTLSGINTFTGSTTINGGGLILSGLLGNGTYSASIINNASFILSNSSSQALLGIISGSGSITQSGSGTTVLSGVNTYTGGTTINSGTLVASNAAALGASTNSLNVAGGTLALSNGVTQGSVTLGNGTITGSTLTQTSFNATNSGAAVVASVLAGTGNFTQSGTGTTTLSATNTYNGTTTIGNGATLQVTGLLGGNNYAANVTNSGSLIFSNAGTQTLGGVISGAGSITVGAGTYSLNNASSTFSGGLTITGGTVNIGADSTGFGTNMTSGALGTGTVILSGGTLNLNGKTNGNNMIATASTTSVFNNAAGDSKNYGSLSGSGNVIFTNSSGTALTTHINNTDWSGFTGTLTWGQRGSAIFNMYADTNVNISGGNIVLNNTTDNFGGNGTTNFTIQLGSLSGAGNLWNWGTVVVGGTSSNAVFTGLYKNYNNAATNAGNLLKVGTNSQTFANANSTYTGTTTVQNGALIAGASAPSGANGAFGNASSAIVLGDATTISTNAAFAPQLLIGGAFTVGRAITVGANTNSLGTAGTTFTIGGSTANASAFTGTISLNQNLQVTQVAGGTLGVGAITNANTSGSETITFANAGSVNATNAIGAAAGGSIALIQGGAGTTTLSGVNTYTGGTTITNGTLVSSNAYAVGSNAVTVNGGVLSLAANLFATTISLGNGTISGAYALTNTGVTATNSTAALISANLAGTGGLTQGGAGTTTLSGSNSYTGSTSVTNGTLLVSGLLGGGAYAGAITNNAALIFSNSAAQTLSGVISGTGNFTQSGTGTTTLSATNTYSGTTTIGAGGTLLVRGLLGGGTYTNTVVNNGSLVLSNSANQTFTNTISGSGAITQSGNSTLYLTGSNSFGGGLTINSGTVAVNGDNGVGTGTLTLNGGTFQNNTTSISPTITNAIYLGANGGTIKLGVAANLYLTGSLSGGGNLTLAPAGGPLASLYLNFTTNTASGTITIPNSTGNNQTVTRFGTAAAGSANATWSIGGAQDRYTTLNFGTGTISFGALTGSGNIQQAGGGVTTVSVGALGTNSTFGGTFSENTGSIALQKVGNGTLILSGGSGSTYSGGTYVNAGTLVASNSASAFGTGALNVAGGTVNLGGYTVANALNLTSGTLQNGTLSNSTGTFNLQNGAVTATLAGGAGLSKSGSGTVTLSQANTYSGATTISGGTLVVGATNGIASSSGVTISSGGTLQFDTANSTLSIKSLTMSGNAILAMTQPNSAVSSTGAMTVTGTGTTNTIALSGVWNNAPGNYTLVTFSSLTLSNPSTLAISYQNGTATLGNALNYNKSSYTLNSNATSLYLTVASLNASLYWSGNPFNNQWNTTDTNWTVNSDGSGSTDAFSTGNDVTFGNTATTGVITAASDITAGVVSVTNTSGTVVLNGAGTITGSSFVKNGNGNLVISNALSITGGVAINGTNNTTLGAVSANLLTMNGAGTLTLAGSNSYSSGMAFNSGTLALGANDVFAGSTTLTLGNRFDLAGYNQTLAALAGTGTVTSTTGGGTLSISNNSGTTIANNLTGGLALANTGSGTTTINTSNSYSGGTAVNAGTLALGNNNALGNGTITLNGGGIINQSSSVPTITNSINVASNSQIRVAAGSGYTPTLILNGNISGSGNIAFRGDNYSGTLVLGGSNSNYQGTFTQNYTNASGVANGSRVIFSSANAGSAGASWQFNDLYQDRVFLQFGTGTISFGALSGVSSITAYNATGGATTVRVGDLNSNTIYSAGMKESNGNTISLLKVGTGTLTLASQNAYTGGTVVNQGALSISNGGAVGGIRGALTINTNATVNLLVGDALGYGTAVSTVTINGGTLNNASANNNGFITSFVLNGGTVTNSGGGRFDVQSGYGVTSLSNSATSLWSAQLFIRGNSGNNLTISNAVGSTVNGIDLQFSGPITQENAGATVTKTGNGTTLLSGTNTYSGTTTISGGTLIVSGLLGSGSYGSAIANSGSLIFSNSAAQTLSGNILGTGTFTQSGTGTTTLSGSNSFAGGTVVNGGQLTAANSNALGTNGNNLTVNGGKVSLGTNNYTLGAVSLNGTNAFSGTGTITATSYALTNVGGTLSESLAGSGATLSKGGSDTLTLSGANSYKGATTVNGGTLVAGSSTAFGTGDLNVNAGATADIGSNNLTQGAVTLASGASLNGTGVLTGTSFTLNNSGTIAASLAGAANLSKSGTGNITLSGSNTYTGTTTINGGTLQLDGSLVGSSGLVLNGATFSMANGSLQSLSFGSSGLNLAATGASTLSFDLIGATNDTISTASALTLGNGNVVINLNNSGMSAGVTNTLITWGSASIGSGAFVLGSNNQLDFGVNAIQIITNETSLQVTALGNSINTAYWVGDQGSFWTNNDGSVGNFATNATDTTGNANALPSVVTDVYFAQSTNSTNTLGKNFLVKSLNFTGTGTTTIQNDGNTIDLGTGGLNVANGSVATVGVNLLGAGSVINNGNLTLSGSNSYSGGTLLSSGTLVAGNRNALSTGGVDMEGGNLTVGASNLVVGQLTNNAGTLDLNGYNLTLTNPVAGDQDGLTTAGGNIVNNASGTNAILTVSSTNTTTVVNNYTLGTLFGANLQDGTKGSTLALVKTGGGILTLFGNNTYSGGTTINQGTLVAPQLPANGSVTINGGVLDIFGGYNFITGTQSATSVGTFVLGNGTVTDTYGGGVLSATNFSVTNGLINVSLTGSGALTKNGSGTVVLNAYTYTYTGGTVVNNGTLDASASGVTLLGSGSLTVNGGTLALGGNNNTVGNFTMGGGTLSGTGTLTGTSYTLLGGTLAAYLAPGSVTVSGSGTSTLGLANAFSNSSLTVSNGATLNLGGTSQAMTALTGSGRVTNSAGGSLTINLATGATDQFDGVISGAGNFAMANDGTGTMILTASNTYTGITTINGGTLLVTGALGNGSYAGGITNNGSLVFSNAASQVLSGAISGTGALRQSGTGVLILQGTANTYSGGTFINSGTLQVGNGSPGISQILGLGDISIGAGTLAFSPGGSGGHEYLRNNFIVNGGTIVANDGNDHIGASTNTITIGAGGVTVGSFWNGKVLFLDGQLTGSGSLTAVNMGGDGGTTTITGNSNTYSGNITVTNSGTITLTGTLSNASSITIASGSTFNANSASNQTISGNIANNGTLNFGSAATQTFSGSISGGSGVNQNGSGTTILSGNNTFAGGLSVNAGNLLLSGSNNFGSGGQSVNANGTMTLVANAGNTASGVSYALGTNNKLGIYNASTLSLLSDSNVTFSGGEGLGGVGNASITFNVGNINAGNSNNTIRFSTNGYNYGNSIFNVTGTNGYTLRLGILRSVFNGPLTLNATTGNLIVDGIAGSGVTGILTVSGAASTTIGAISGGVTSLTKNGTGQLLLSAANSYSGGTTVSGGTLQAGNANAFGTGGVTVNSGAVLDLNGQTIANSLTLSGSGIGGNGAIINSAAGTSAADTTGFNMTTFTVGGAGNLLLNNTNTNSSFVTITKTGSGTFTMGPGSAYSGNYGTLVVNGGTAVLASTNQSILNAVTVNAGTLQFTTNYLATNGQTWQGQVNATINLASNGAVWDLNGTTGKNNQFQQLQGAAGSIVTNSSAAAANFNLQARDTNTYTFAGNIVGNIGVTMAQNYASNRVNIFSGTNTYTGTTTLNSTTLRAGSTGALSSNSAYTIGNSTNAFLDLNGYNNSVGSLSGGNSGTTNIILNGGTLTVGANNTSTSLAGRIGDGAITGGGLVKTGSGTLTLTGQNSYSGATTINGGTLSVSATNTISSLSAISLANNALFQYTGGAGTLGNNFTVSSGSTGIINNSGGGLLTLTGTLTKQGSILQFYGGSYNVTGKITGNSGSFDSDLVLSNASVTLGNIANNYVGATKILSGSTLTAGVANALPTSTKLYLGAGGESSSVTNGYSLNGYSQTLGGLYTAGNGINRIYNDSATQSLLTLAGSSTFGGSISGNIALNVSSGSTVNLTGLNSYTGATTINGGSTIDLGGGGRLTATSNVIVSGGSTLLLGGNRVENPVYTQASVQLGGKGNSSVATLSMGGLGATSRTRSQSFTTLTLTGNSVIDFANLTGTSDLTFSSINGLGTYTLSIYNWNGTNRWGTTSETGGVGQYTHLFDSSKGLGNNDLANISFYSGGAGSTFLGNGFYSGTEIVPVPEPGVVIAACMLLGWLLVANRGTLVSVLRRRA